MATYTIKMLCQEIYHRLMHLCLESKEQESIYKELKDLYIALVVGA